MRKQLVVSEVLSESVQELCQLAEGDVVTHIDGYLVGGVSNHKALDALHRRHRMNYRQQCQQHRQQQSSVVEIRLIRARSLKKRQPPPPPPTLAQPTSILLLPHIPVFYYETHARDTLASVAVFFQTTPQDIRNDNRDFFRMGEKAGTLHPGLLLKIRNPDYYHVSTGEKEEEAASPLPMLSSSSSPPQPVPSGGNGGSSLTRRYHKVQDGETVENIARQHHVALMDLRKWNRHFFPTGEVVRALSTGTQLLLFTQEPTREKQEKEEKKQKERECTLPIAIQLNEEDEEEDVEDVVGTRRSNSISPE